MEFQQNSSSDFRFSVCRLTDESLVSDMQNVWGNVNTRTHVSRSIIMRLFVERSGSGILLWILDYENPGSNPVLLR